MSDMDNDYDFILLKHELEALDEEVSHLTEQFADLTSTEQSVDHEV